ncbi:patatin-like protein [Croceicoccus ponticola]|uniref:Patatin-like protein n=1 Tax=Croceicoccus ponticola TaxID=2217664 RepID=A0A437GXR5_9SPHN|nr:patatin-like protein [Croceicoccus ponticola]RVQ67160.1 patatin-like protein [Croceicoccus ponticola]
MVKEKELRLALVLYGGVSLAIYQHGVNREILNLVRASRSYHSQRSQAIKQDPSHTYEQSRNAKGPVSTEPVYFNLLKALGQSFNLRVIVDIISGSSAGGINAVTLGRAIAHDLDLAPQTSMWLEQADIISLLAPEARAKSWSKWYIWPIARLLFVRMVKEGLLPPESSVMMRRRISKFIRSRWFKPPLDGTHFLELLTVGLEAMRGDMAKGATLLPSECSLDVFLSVTDFHGVQRPIFIHDPPVVYEREHKRLIRFTTQRSPGFRAESEFDDGNIPGLAFASRATASYPGAFPPCSVGELDRFLGNTGRDWPERDAFFQGNFAADLAAGARPEDFVFLDGSVLNNRPVQAAIDAISEHYAYRDVDRRLVYVDPHPARDGASSALEVPGFFSTIRSALSDLPRTIPIYEELEKIGLLNAQVDRLQEIVEISRKHVIALIEQATKGTIGGKMSEAELRHLRLTSTNALARMALVYDPWIRALVREGIDVVAAIIDDLCHYSATSREAVWVKEVVEAWCTAHGILINDYLIPDNVAQDADLPAFSRFIVYFAIPYKKRRISLIISSVNSLYRRSDDAGGATTSSSDLDQLKKRLSECLEDIDRSSFGYRDHPALASRAQMLFCSTECERYADPAAYAAVRDGDITKFFEELEDALSLVGSNEELDELLTSPLLDQMEEAYRQEIRSGYVGFPYWDIVLLQAMSVSHPQRPETYSFSNILVDRISPIDGDSFKDLLESRSLLGSSVIGFGGFMSREARENDYLWGRLNGVERLIDIIASAVTDGSLRASIDFRAYKREAFKIVLDQEGELLTTATKTVDAIRALLSKT